MDLFRKRDMMSDFILMTDNTADLPVSFYQENDIPVMSLTYTLEGTTYDQDNSVPMKEFYQKMREGAMPVTSQINPQTAQEMFR